MNISCNLDLDPRSKALPNLQIPASSSLPLRVISTGHFYAGNSYMTERNEQNDYLILYTIEGAGALAYRGRQWNLRKGSLAVVDCNEYHLYKTVGNFGWNFKYIHFQGKAAAEYFALVNGGGFKPIEIKNKQINAKFEKIYEIIDLDRYLPDLKVCAQTVALLTDIICEKKKPQKSSGNKYKSDVDDAIYYIKNHYSTLKTIDEICEHIHLSKYHFIRVFKEHTGFSPYEYLTNYRITVAKYYLSETNFSVDDIARRIGYGDSNSFIKRFKAAANTTPYQYRKNNSI